MRILSVELENFRKFDRPHRVDGFGPGLNVLSGPNEHGKSTLLAAIGAALFEKHDSRAAPIRGFQTRGHETAPRVAVEFAVGDLTARIEKRFLLRPEARLTTADGARHEGDAAETRLRDLLGFDRQGGKVDLGLWSALWVAQGASFEQADLTGERACRTIGACLEAELGSLTGTGRADRVLVEAEAALDALRDRRDRPRGRLRELLGLIASLDEQIAAADSLISRVGGEASELDRLRRERAALRARLADNGTEELIRDARVAREAALNRAARIDAARAAHRLAADRAGTAKRTVDTRLDAREEAARLDEAARASTDRSRTAQTALDDVLERLSAAERARSAARTERDDALAGLRAAEAAHGIGERRAMLRAREALLGRARAAAETERLLRARLFAHPVTADALRAIRDDERVLATSRARLEASAATLLVLPEPGAPSATIRHGSADRNTALDPGTAIPVLDEIELAIPGFGRVRIRPAAGRDRDEARKDAERAAASLLGRLAALGVASVAEAVDALRARDEDERRLAAACAELARLVPGDELNGLAPGLEPLAALVDTLRLGLGQDQGGEDGTDRREELVQAGQRDASTAEALATAEARLAPLARERAAAEIEAAEARVAAELALRAAGERRLSLDLASAASPDALLAAAADAAADAAGDAARALDALLAADEGALDADTLAQRIGRLTEARDNDRNELARLAERIATLRARLDEAGGNAVAERRAEAVRTRDALAREAAALERDSAALALLVDTLRDAVAETRTAALAPLARRMEPHLARLLPGARVRYDDAYGVRAISRRDGADEPFAELSHGTREQVAILARLALADVLVDSGRPSALVLDDALVFSDADRIDRMFDAIGDLATRVQVLVLTCRADLFSRLGGRRLHLEPAKAAAG